MAVNAPGLQRLGEYLTSGKAMAFLGAGASAPLYPLWTEVVSQLIDAAVARGLAEEKAGTCRAVAGEQPDAVVELLRRHLGPAQYAAALREVFRVRRDPDTGRTWTPTQELVCRCAFKAVVTTNYDPGIVDARMRVRPRAYGTGFASWTDELALDRWRTGEVFGDDELPVLFAHGHHNQPEAMVLATTEYRRAYGGKLSRLLASMVDTWHLVWIGFSFADQRIGSVLREVAEHAGTRIDPGGAVRHVAVMAWDPDGGRDPQVLRSLAEIQYGADLILYPAPKGDHSALQRLLADFTVVDYPPAHPLPAPVAVPHVSATEPLLTPLTTQWTPQAEKVEHFTGRVEELARLRRWAADPAVRLVGVTAWGGAGKTALVTHWVNTLGGASARPGVRGVFGWSFYANASAEEWAEALLDWAYRELGVPRAGRGRTGAAVLRLLERMPLLLVLDGLEVVQEGPVEGRFGRLLDGTLREVLTGACQVDHAGLVVLTSRFPFADLEGFDGTAARMLDVPPFTPAEGAALLASAGGGWLPDRERQELTASVDGHALAVAVLGAVLAERPPTTELTGLRGELATAAGTDTRVARLLRFYADRLTEADRYLVAAVALFSHPVTPQAVLAVARHETFAGRLAGWAPGQVEAAARNRLAGLVSWHPDGTLSAHPLVRDTFRPLARGAAQVAAETVLTGVPDGTITSRQDGLRVVEAIELLLDAGQLRVADSLYRSWTDNGEVWKHLPAARLGQHAASAFVTASARLRSCGDLLSPPRLLSYLNAVGFFSMISGDLVTAREYLDASNAQIRQAEDWRGLSIVLGNLTECLACCGEVEAALHAAEEAATYAALADDSQAPRNSAACRGWVLMLTGDTLAAEEQFITADQLEYARDGDHLCSIGGTQWGEFLVNTGRTVPARVLTERNRYISFLCDWHVGMSRCDRLLARLDLVSQDMATAGPRLAEAVTTFRDGDYLVDLAATLPLLAECLRIGGDLDGAERHSTEAIAIAAPRQLRLSHAAGLAVRARTYADRAAKGDRQHLERGRDAADAAFRIATRHRLPWHELDAVQAHVHLDEVEGTDHSWAAKAAKLHERLVPEGLDPDPLATVERRVAEDRARERGLEGQ